jgi:hypothetical protein
VITGTFGPQLIKPVMIKLTTKPPGGWGRTEGKVVLDHLVDHSLLLLPILVLAKHWGQKPVGSAVH